MTEPTRMKPFLRFKLYFSITLIHFLMMMIGFGAIAQVSSQFEVLDSPADQQIYESALSNANLEPYRFQDVDRTLRFDNGVEFKLASSQSLLSEESYRTAESYPHSSELDPAITLIFRIAGDGQLGVTSEIDPNSKLAKIGAGFPSGLKTIFSQAEFDQLPEAKKNYILANPDKYGVK